MYKYIFTSEQYDEMSALLKDITHMSENKYQGQHENVISDLNKTFATIKRVRVFAPGTNPKVVTVGDAKLVVRYEMDIKYRGDMILYMGRIRYRKKPEFTRRLNRLTQVLKSAALENVADGHTGIVVALENAHTR